MSAFRDNRDCALFLTGHDFRSARQVDIHFFALAARSLFREVRVFSIGFSPLRLLTKDPRRSLASRANRWELFKGVHCYLWRTPWHPFGAMRRVSERLARALYRTYAELPCAALDNAILQATTIVVESGLSPVLLSRIERINPKAEVIYLASDLLSTIRVHPIVEEMLQAALPRIQRVRIPARVMAPAFEKAADRVVFLPHGLDRTAGSELPNPYGPGRHVVSVGSMLFDPTFFLTAAPRYPEVTFHVIGAGRRYSFPENVCQYGEMPFDQTSPYIRFADVGLAPYTTGPSASYLADSSMKLAQYGAAGIPAVCPHFAVGDHPGRYGYDPEDSESAVLALGAALADARDWPPQDVLDWPSLAERLFAPVTPVPSGGLNV